MNREALKDALYGGIIGLMENPKYFYTSSIPKYSSWTVEGANAAKDYILVLASAICEAEKKELDKRAKEIVLKTLKGEKE